MSSDFTDPSPFSDASTSNLAANESAPSMGRYLLPDTSEADQRFGATDHLLSSIVIGMTFKLGPAALFETKSGCAVEIHAIRDYISIGCENITGVRHKIAKRAQINVESMPIVALHNDNELSVAVLLPRHMAMSDLLERAGDIINDTIRQWTSGINAAAHGLNNIAHGSAESQAAESPHEAAATAVSTSANATEPERNAIPPDSCAERIHRSLVKRNGIQDVSLNFVAGGRIAQSPPETVKAGSRIAGKQVHYRLSEPLEITARITRIVSAHQCELREEGSSRNVIAAFSSYEQLGMLLKFLPGFPAVRLMVKKYVCDTPDTQAKPAFMIEALLGLTPQWQDYGEFINDYEACLDTLKKMMDRDAPSLPGS